MNISKSKEWANDIIIKDFWKVCGILIISYMISNITFVFFVIRVEASYYNINLTSFVEDLISWSGVLYYLILTSLFFVRAGIAKYIMKLANNENASFNDIIHFYGKEYIRCFKAGLCYYISIVCPVILLPLFGVIVSIVLVQGLALVPYLLADERYKDLNASEIIKKSYIMMRGYKMKHLLLSLSFFLWYILIHMTYSVAGFYVIPYSLLSHGKFLYDIIQDYEKNTINKSGSYSLIECPHCNKLIRKGSSYCSECGYKI